MSKRGYPAPHAVSTTRRPERPYTKLTWLDLGLRQAYRLLLWPGLRHLSVQPGLIRRIIARSEQLQDLSELEFAKHRQDVQQRLVREGINGATLQAAFAMIREAADRSLGMRHHHTQVRASLVMLQGRVAEMATGEGKTLACTLAAATAALAGVKVHVVTTNDYLAERDCEEMSVLYKALGLSVGALVNGLELPERQAIYDADIVYCSNNELVFDYLKDTLMLGECRDTLDLYRDTLKGSKGPARQKLMHQGLIFAIVDEADSVFIDESRTPLVISGGDAPMAESEDFLRAIYDFALELALRTHYRVDHQFRKVLLLDAGRDALKAHFDSAERPLDWHQQARSEELLVQALSAIHLYQRDKHYIVGDGKVMIVDEYTGRLAPDRSWEGGLHQMIEVKEECEITQPQKTLAKISYQQFFRKYFYLSGMSGTAREVSDELYGVYGLLVSRVPLLRRSRRRRLGYRVYPSMAAKEQAIVASVQAKVEQGRAVLVGTATVDQSERLAQRLEAAGVAFELLTAKQDADEADIVAKAGQPGRVTIATSMAGRGTDIKLAGETREAGGLHVIICELQDASRIDRQLEGRCARQGDPGSTEYLLSFEDPLVQVYGRSLYQLARPAFSMPLLAPVTGKYLQRYCQWRLERKHARERRLTLRSDERERKTLAFLGGGRWS